MISKKKLYSGDFVRLRDGRLGYITLSPVCIRGTSVSSYDKDMKEDKCYKDVDVVAVCYTSKHSMNEIAEKYISMANEHDDGK